MRAIKKQSTAYILTASFLLLTVHAGSYAAADGRVLSFDQDKAQFADASSRFVGHITDFFRDLSDKCKSNRLAEPTERRLSLEDRLPYEKVQAAVINLTKAFTDFNPDFFYACIRLAGQIETSPLLTTETGDALLYEYSQAKINLDGYIRERFSRVSQLEHMWLENESCKRKIEKTPTVLSSAALGNQMLIYAGIALTPTKDRTEWSTDDERLLITQVSTFLKAIKKAMPLERDDLADFFDLPPDSTADTDWVYAQFSPQKLQAVISQKDEILGEISTTGDRLAEINREIRLLSALKEELEKYQCPNDITNLSKDLLTPLPRVTRTDEEKTLEGIITNCPQIKLHKEYLLQNISTLLPAENADDLTTKLKQLIAPKSEEARRLNNLYNKLDFKIKVIQSAEATFSRSSTTDKVPGMLERVVAILELARHANELLHDVQRLQGTRRAVKTFTESLEEITKAQAAGSLGLIQAQTALATQETLKAGAETVRQRQAQEAEHALTLVKKDTEIKLGKQNAEVAKYRALQDAAVAKEKSKHDAEAAKLIADTKEKGATDRLSKTLTYAPLGAAALIGTYFAARHYYTPRPKIIEASDTSIFGILEKIAGIRVPPSNIDSVVLSPELQEAVLEKFLALENAIKAHQPLSNMLFAGPPGTGKTMAAVAFARRLYERGIADHVIIRGAAFKRLGTAAAAQTALADVLRWASKNKRPVILIFDEAETMFTERSSHYANEMSTDLTVALLSFFEKAVHNNMMFILSTNHPDRLDEAVLNRIDPSNQVDFTAPTQTERIKLLTSYLEQVLSHANYTIAPEVLDSIPGFAAQLNGMVGRQIESLAVQALYLMSSRHEKILSADTLQEAIRRSLNKRVRKS